VLATLATVAATGACAARASRSDSVPRAAPTTSSSTTTVPATTTVAPGTAARAPSTTASPPQPSLRSLTLPFVDTSRPTVSRGRTISPSRALTTLVWYPGAGGPWPLLVFAHGYQVGPAPYLAMLETWAAAGYVVAAPEFPLTDAAVAGPDLDENDLDNQPADVRFVIRSLLTTSPVAGHIDSTRLGVAGHSDGAETALALAGDPSLRLRAAITLSVQPLASGPPGNPPLLVGQGDRDTINPPSYGQAVYQQAARPKFYLDLLGAGHLPPFSGAGPWAPVVDRATVDFLDHYLAGRTSGTGALMSDGRSGVATIEGAT
jgi:dienelactone hydrolase